MTKEQKLQAVTEARKMLRHAWKLTHTMQKYLFLAIYEKDEKKRDDLIEKVIACNEMIEQLYSTNWH